MWLLLVPIVVVVVVMLVIGSLFAGLFWLVGSTWPWLLIALGAWLFWRQDGRHYRRRHGRSAWMSRAEAHMVHAQQRPTRPDSKRSKAAQPAQLKAGELPIDVQVKVEQIRRKVDVLLSYADRFPPFSQDLYLVRQTATDYLPRTLNNFQSMPPEAVDRPLHPGGKTARQELQAQLDLLDSKLDEIAQDLQRQDADRLLANRRFLESRFGEREKETIII
jgi:ABC-type nickel/cobalt efflux system permease component RcnA